MSQFTSKIFGLFICLSLSSYAFASQVPVEEAQSLARTAFAMKANYKFSTAADIKIKNQLIKKTGEEAAYYIFNMEPTGFVIVSADDRYNAILAFSDESQIDFDNDVLNGPMWATLGKHELRIDHIKRTGLLPAGHIKKEWKVLRSEQPDNYLTKDPDGMVIPPLTTTKWNQGRYYNAYTPGDDGADAVDGRTYCGCAPIAMAQLIKYHNYPPRGNGSNTYEDPSYGEQTANFCSTEYNWDNMPDSLLTYNDDVAEFIYQVGVATNTSYSTVYTDTYNSYVRDALVNFFNFDESASWFSDVNGEFARVAINDLNRGLPVMLTGTALTGGGHSWVADGYGYFLDPGPNQPDEYFHFNWGWGGDNNGWFLDTDATWAPIPFETGTTFINYYYERLVIHNVFPSSAGCPAPSRLYTSGLNQNATYLHVSSGVDDEEVVFRYRENGAPNWSESTVTTNYYYRISNLEPGTDYEFQVKRKCCITNWSDFSDSEFFTTPGVITSPCDSFIESSLTTSSISENSAYIYTSKPYGNVNNQFRFRFLGSLIWTYTDHATTYYRNLRNLEPGTEYEFQVRHQCEPGQWTNFTESAVFTTAGITGCSDIFELDLFTSSTDETRTYVYTSQPYGRVDNQFRYREIGTTTWQMSDITDSYYRYLRNLSPGTEYEFQVAHLCQGWAWTDWSFSHSFRTTGGNSESCAALSGDRLYNSSVTRNNAYLYTPQPFGLVANQFRYRVVGTTNWINTPKSTLYYRYLRDLTPNSDYEFQVAHECEFNNWTEWSTSQTFETLAFQGGGQVGKVLLTPTEVEHRSSARLARTDLTLFPNPVSNELTIHVAKVVAQDLTIQVYNMQGQAILETIIAEGQDSQKVNVSELDKGLYLMHYNDGIENRAIRFIKN